MVEEKKEVVDPAAQKGEAANADEQKVMNEEILNADRAQNVPIEKTEEKAEEKPKGESEEKTEEKAEEKKPAREESTGKEEKVDEEKKTPETKAPQSEDEKEIDKILQQFKGDSKEVAKGYQNVRKLADRLGVEVGDKRKIEEELSTLKKRMEDDPEAVAKELLTKKRMTEGNLLDQAIEDPDVLPTYIQSEIKKGIASFVDGQKLETALEEQYSGYKESAKKAQVKELIRLYKAKQIPLEELAIWATDGYKFKDKIEEVTKVLKEELEKGKATKHDETVDKQGVVTGEKEEDEDDPQKVYPKTLLELER